MQEPSPFGRYVDDMQGAVLSCKKDPLLWYPQGRRDRYTTHFVGSTSPCATVTLIDILDIPHIRRRPSKFRITHPIGLARIFFSTECTYEHGDSFFLVRQV